MSAEKKLPDGWEGKRLGEVCEIMGGGTPSTKNEEYWRGDIPWVSPKDMKSKLISESIDHISEIALRESATNAIKEGSLLIVVRSGILAHTIPLGITQRRVSINQDLKALIPKSIIDIHFLYYYFCSVENVLLSQVTRGATVHRLQSETLLDNIIPLPPLSEQKRIVAILDGAFQAIDRAKENAEKNLANAREVFDGFLDQVFSNPGKDWEEKRLGDVCEFVRGPFGGSLKKEIFKPTGYAVYEQQHAINNKFTEIRYYIDERKYQEMKRFEISPGDLIMSCSGTMGKTAIVPSSIEKGIINQALLKLTPSSTLFVDFLQIWMSTVHFQNQLTQFSQGAAIQNVASVKILKDIVIPLPNVQTQHEIVEKVQSFLTETHRLESIYKKKKSALGELRKIVLKKAFSGEL